MRPDLQGCVVDDWVYTGQQSRWWGLWRWRSESLQTSLWAAPGDMVGRSVVALEGELEDVA